MLIFTHRLFASKNYIRAVIFCIFANTALVTQAMDSANSMDYTRDKVSNPPVSLSELLRAQRTAVESLLDGTLAHLDATGKKKHIQRLLMSAAQAGGNKENSPTQIRLVIQLLLDRGADPLEPDRFGATAFSQSCYISSYPIMKNIIYRLTMGTLDSNYHPNPKEAPLLWLILERIHKYPVYRLVETALECDANPDILNEHGESLLDRFLQKKERLIQAQRYPEYSRMVRLLYRYGATTNQKDLRDYFDEQEAREIEQERTVYRADEAYLLDAYTLEQYPAISEKPLQIQYVLKLQEFSPVQIPTPLVNLIADYSGNNSFVIKREQET